MNIQHITSQLHIRACRSWTVLEARRAHDTPSPLKGSVKGKSKRVNHICSFQTAPAPAPAPAEIAEPSTAPAPTDVEYDAVVIGGGVGGLAAATQLAAKGAKVLVLEKYTIPGGSAGQFKRGEHDEYTFDVGSSMMFGFGDKGTTNLITRALAAVGRSLETIPDPTQVFYHLPASERHPQGLHIKVWRDYGQFLEELSSKFPHEKANIARFYDECWAVFNALNSIEFKSLEEPRFLLQQFAAAPLPCLKLFAVIAKTTGELARKYIKDEELLHFIDVECYCWSTVLAEFTPLVNAGMVFGDRHYGGINYPKGGVGRIAEELVEGLKEAGGLIEYRAPVREILSEQHGEADRRATGVRLADGRTYRGKAIISNATRWDTFGSLLGPGQLPREEELFKTRYKKAPSFLSIHMAVRADVLPEGTECHHIIVEDWGTMESARGCLFVSIPSLLDPSLCPPGTHIVHAFTTDWIDAWQGLEPREYERRKEAVADAVLARIEAHLPGLRAGTLFREVGTPRTHRRFLNRADGSYGPIPARRPLGALSMPLNRTAVQGLYCVGDSTFPGQGVNAVVFSGFGCAHRVLCDLGRLPTIPGLDGAFNNMLAFIRNRS